jgi:hypothetical protein
MANILLFSNRKIFLVKKRDCVDFKVFLKSFDVDSSCMTRVLQSCPN